FSGTSDDIDTVLEAVLGPVGDGPGIECFYSHQISKTLVLTPDIQWVSPARQQVDDSIVLGARLNMIF
ncbi:MAG: carbohydrate porin, partial [Planctomycetota bacterium]